MEVTNGNSTPQGEDASAGKTNDYKLTFCTVCASNNNRSVCSPR